MSTKVSITITVWKYFAKKLSLSLKFAILVARKLLYVPSPWKPFSSTFSKYQILP